MGSDGKRRQISQALHQRSGSRYLQASHDEYLPGITIEKGGST